MRPERVRPRMAAHQGIFDAYDGLPGWLQLALRVLLVLVVGWIVVRVGTRLLVAAMERGGALDATVRTFLGRLLKAVGYVLLGVVALTMLGVDLTALMGGLAVGGFIVGFALKDTLGNLAAGFILLLYRPFNVGDFVDIGGFPGTVLELGISLTTLRRFDGVIVTIPNGSVLGGPIVNFTRASSRRASAAVAIRREDDVDAAIKAVLEAAQRDPRVLEEPKPEVVVTRLGESSVELEVRAWAKPADFGPLNGQLPAIAKRAVEAAGCAIPFPHREIRLVQSPPQG